MGKQECPKNHEPQRLNKRTGYTIKKGVGDCSAVLMIVLSIKTSMIL